MVYHATATGNRGANRPIRGGRQPIHSPMTQPLQGGGAGFSAQFPGGVARGALLTTLRFFSEFEWFANSRRLFDNIRFMYVVPWWASRQARDDRLCHFYRWYYMDKVCGQPGAGDYANTLSARHCQELWVVRQKSDTDKRMLILSRHRTSGVLAGNTSVRYWAMITR